MKTEFNRKGLIARMLGGTVSLGSLSLVSLMLGLLSTMLIARHFPVEAFGTFVLLQVIVSFLITVSSLGMNLSITKFVAGTEDEARRQDLVSMAILLRVSAIVVTSLVAWLIRSLLLQWFGATVLSDLLIFLPVLFLLESLHSLLKSILQGFFRFSRIGITDLMTSSLNLLLVLAFVVLQRIGVVDLIVARALAVFIAGVFAYLSIPIKKKLALRRDITRELIKFGLPLELNDILAFFFSRVDTLVVGMLLGPASIAFYEIARKIPDSLRQLYEPFRSVYFAFSSRLYTLGERDEAARLLNNSTRLISFITCLGAAIALVYGKDIMQLIFSAKYLPSAPIFALLMINLSVSLIGNVLGTTLVSVGESNKPAIVNLFNAAGSLLGCVLFIPLWGTTGAAMGNLLGTITVYPPMMTFLRRKIDAKVMPYLKPIIIFCAWAAPVLLLAPGSFLTKSGFIVIFLGMCVLLSVVTKNDLQLLLIESGVASWRPIQYFREKKRT